MGRFGVPRRHLLPSIAVDMLTHTSTPVNMSSVKLIQEIDAACCPPVVASPLDDEGAARLAQALRVIADPARLRLVSIVASSGESCVCDLTDVLRLSQPTVSHHLKVLTDAGILRREKRGRWAYYRVDPEPLELLRSALDPAAALVVG
jgi:ArsR family transcriptional regulator, arsenate/arsenite/antimonite-responsive transcriptional repressor